ncbi:MAG: hypothetical protein J6A88_05980 [Oscillospiraceae bacterium]|nr:hypothetical protein [Oscillospiraceae bacterium]
MRKSLNKRLKIWAIALSVILVLSLTVGGTLAYMMTRTDPVNNQFEDAYVTCRVNRDGDIFDVTNTGNINAFIRATIVINWMDGNGNVRGIAPTGADVTLSVNETDWTVMDDGYLYYTRPVAPDQNTNDLITAITLNVAPPDGYRLSVEVVAEAIQAEGVTSDSGLQAILDAWGNN